MNNVSLTLTGQPISTGGTKRRVTARMIERPWKVPHPNRGITCPFCPPEQNGKLDELANKGEVVEWFPKKENYVLASLTPAFTTFSCHELLITRDCETQWPNRHNLSLILKTIFDIHDKRIWTNPDVTNAQFGFHYGQLGAQNMFHPHWHIVGSDWPQPNNCPWCNWPEKSEFTVKHTQNLVAILDGTRAGETVVASRIHNWNYGQSVYEIAEMLDELQSLFSSRFNDPDFMISSAIAKNGHFMMIFTPILNHLGCSEVLAARGLGPYSHACSPEGILEHLKTRTDQ